MADASAWTAGPAPTQSAPGWTVGAAPDGAVAPPPPALPTFLSNLTDTVTGAPAAIAHSIMNPRESLKAWRDQSQTLHDAATDAFERGDYEAAAVHGINFLANVVPGLGASMDEAATATTPDEFKAKLGNVVGNALLMKAPEMIKGGAEAAATGAKATASAAADAASKLKDAANHPIAGMAVDAISAVHPGFAHVVSLGKKGMKVADALNKAFGGAVDDTPANPNRPIGPPAAVPANEMRTPQFEDVPDVPRRTNVPAEAEASAPAAADPNAAIRDGIAQGFKFKNFAAIKDANIAATVQRLADQQIARESGTPAAPAPAPAVAPPAGWTAGPAPAARTAASDAAIPRAQTLKPDVASMLKEGAVRENPDGSRQVLQRVPLDKIASDPGNEIYPDVVGSYQRNGYTVHPELRANEDGGLTVQEGHHRLAADAKNGKTEVLAWIPEADRTAPTPEAAAPAPAPAPAEAPTLLQTVDQGIKRSRPGGMFSELNDQMTAEIEARKKARAAQQPPPGEPGEAASPAATPPPPAAPAAPAAATPPKAPAQYGKQYITPGQVTKYAAENGLAEGDATAALEKQGVSVVDRSSTNRVLHAIGAELGYNHATLSEIAHATYGTGLGKMTHEQMMELAEKLGNEQATKEPLATKRTGSKADPTIAPEAEGSPLGGVVQDLPTSEIHADPVRFQYKAGMGQGGAGDELRGVTKFDPEKSGILSVWKDPADGKTYVANGHHRLELAQRTGAEGLTVRYIDAANAAEARAKGAMINIAEGRGTSIDAAKVFRDSGATAEDLQNQGLSLTGSVAKEGQALANLDPHLFNQVVSGEMKSARGAMIGQVAEHSDQRQLIKLIQEREASGKPMSDGQVGELLRMQAPQVTETQHSLFGDDEISRSLIAEKAGVSDYIQNRLTQKRRTFNAVGNERAATRLAEAGNVIDADKNAAIAVATNQEHAVYQKLSTSTGPVADALDEAAKALHAGENPAIVKVRTYAKIEPILKEQADKLAGRSGASGQRSEGSAQAGSAEAGRGKHDRRGEEAPSKVSDLMR